MPFLAAESYDPAREWQAVIRGVPYDGAVSWRAGAASAPAEVRRVSESLESYSPRLGRDLEDLALADAGDLDVSGLGGKRFVDAVARSTEQHARHVPLVVTLGGDHSVSMGTSAGLRSVHAGLACVVVDAHLDMRPDYEGDLYSHACGTRTMASAGPVCALGIRSGERQEFRDADELLAGWSSGLVLTDPMRRALGDRPVLLSVDMDVLDPSVLPGTGNPEPGGPRFDELRDALLGLPDLDVVGVDLVEAAPALDASEISAAAAAALTRELVLRFTS